MSKPNAPSCPRIVVVGGGAGGLELVTQLGKQLGRRGEAEITLIDCSRTHIWKPLLHEVAAGSLDANLDEVGYGGHAVRWGYRFFNGALESIDRETMFYAYTLNAAKALRLDQQIGSLAPGKQADLIVLDRDVFKVSDSELFDTQVLETFFAGKSVYRAEATPAVAQAL